jgi:hypothetical protein
VHQPRNRTEPDTENAIRAHAADLRHKSHATRVVFVFKTVESLVGGELGVIEHDFRCFVDFFSPHGMSRCGPGRVRETRKQYSFLEATLSHKKSAAATGAFQKNHFPACMRWLVA